MGVLSETTGKKEGIREYKVLLRNTTEQERRYAEIDKKINNEIIRLLIQEYTSVEKEKQELKEEIEKLEQEKEAREIAEEEVKAKTKETEQKEKALKEAHKTKKEAEAQLADLQKVIEELRAATEQESGEKAKKIKEVEDLQAKEKDLINELKKKEKVIASKEKELKEEIEKKNKEIERARALSKEIAEVQKELVSREKKIGEKENDISLLETALREGRQMRDKKEEETYEKERDLKRKISELEDKIKTTPECTSAISEEVNRLKIESEISKAKVEEKNKTIEILQGTIARLETLFTRQMEYTIKAMPRHTEDYSLENKGQNTNKHMTEPVRPIPVVKETKLKQKPKLEETSLEKKPLLETILEEDLEKDLITQPKENKIPAKEKSSTKPPAKQPQKRNTVKRKGEVIDFKKELSKQTQAREIKKSKEKDLSDSSSDTQKEKKDFGSLFGKKKGKSVFTGRPEASSFFANLSFSDYEPDTSEK